ncbi:glycosyltransferase family 1 protein [Leisingera aquaemixtae]|uniref:glycosyltransferase family 1 protein n=1 Tax=Leisingera aquaemixtae TaxID=1396826 RepID=UPI001C958170|nr:glycosyltransferase family 1 protein [Leisingera aquaemixtae]MBY6065503.1 glycosyltransferase family 1 protein [Leisingera aquaemixtae]
MTQKFNICLIEPQNYVHSGAFYEIADLLLYALRDLGFEAVSTRNRIDPAARNIVIGIHLLNPSFAKQMPPGTIILNTEQLGAVFGDWNKRILEWFSQDFTLWDYSEANVAHLRDFGVKRVEKLQLGYQKELCRITRRENPDVDVLFYGCINPRRKAVLADLEARGLRVKALFGVYGQDRDAWIARSRIVLNLHYYETQIFEIVRTFYLMTNGVPIAAEVNPGTRIDDCYRDGMLPLPYSQLAAGIDDALKDEAGLAQLGAQAKETIASLPQAGLLREII